MSVNLWLRGGLGNQLFQYSFALLVSRQMSLPLEIHSRLIPCEPDLYRDSGRWPQQISSFNHSGILHTGKCQPPGKTDFASKAHTALGYLLDSFPRTMANLGFIGGQQEKDWGSLIAQVSRRTEVYLNGYFIQKFAPYKLRSELVRQILGQESVSDFSHARPDREYFALHMRLGDNILQNKNLFKYYGAFYKQAVRQVEDELGEQRFILFSDQPEIASDFLRNAIGVRDVSTSKTTSAIQTLREMASCSGLIATPSTFAWWAGFLQENQSRIYMGRPWSNASQFDDDSVYSDAWNLVSTRI